MRMSKKCCNNNNSDNPLTSCRTDGGKNETLAIYYLVASKRASSVCVPDGHLLAFSFWHQFGNK